MLKKIHISIGITAHNEEKNIQRLLESVLKQKFEKITISEIIVVSSGSSDNTNAIVKSLIVKHPLIKLIEQKKRLGKASAVNIVIDKAREKIILLSSADLIIPQGTIEKLIIPFKNNAIGITGSRPIPLNDKNTFFGFAAHQLWDLHHKISLQHPKMGECIAFRKVFKQIPILSSVDEANIESIIKNQGYKVIYIPEAIIYNKGAENLKDFITRRRHIFAGHLEIRSEYGYRVSTLSGIRILFLLAQNFSFSLHFMIWTPFIMALEAYCRILGFVDFKRRKTHTIWKVTKSTKNLPIIAT